MEYSSASPSYCLKFPRRDAYNLVDMEIRKHSERASRYSKEHRVDDHYGGLRTGARHRTITSGAPANDKGMIIENPGDPTGPLGSGKYQPGDYVQKWLAQTMPELGLPSNLALESIEQNVTCRIGPEGSSREFDFESFLQAKEKAENKERMGAHYKSRKRILDVSSESSFLEYRAAEEPTAGSNNAWKECGGSGAQAIPKSRRVRQKIKHQALLENGSVSLSITPRAEVFEKTKRHKTREDRYEPRKAPKEYKSQANKDRKRDKERKIKARSEVIRKAGEDPMHQFSSKSVGQDRLTMRPPCTPGLFNNGRASSPRRWRGLPDLTFSEMGFLRRSKQDPIEVEEKSRCKSREKEKRKASRAQNEISEYFRPSMLTTTDVEINRNIGMRVPWHADKDSRMLPNEEHLKEKYRSEYTKSTSISIDFSNETPANDSRGQDFEQIMAMPHLQGQAVLPKVAPGSRKELSGRETTYFTWSESMGSPIVSQSKENMCSADSTTPESIRRLLDNTGIFAGTGIDRNKGRRHHKELVRHDVQAHSRKPSALPDCISSDRRWCRTSLARPHTQQTIRAVENTAGDHSNSPEARKNHLFHDKRGQRDQKELLLPFGTTIEQYNLGSGWQPHTTYQEPLTHPHPSNTVASYQHISRQLMAQAAYMKRALPTVTPIQQGQDANKASLSTEAPIVDKKSSQKEQIEQGTQTESNIEISQDNPSLYSSQARNPALDPSEVRLVAAQPGMGYCSQSLKSLISDLSDRSELDVLLGASYMPGVPSTLRNISPLYNLRCQANTATQQAAGPETTQKSYAAVDAQRFEVLPIRGSWQSHASGPGCFPRNFLPMAVVEPLYSRQLENRSLYDITELKNIQNIPEDYVLSSLETPSKQHSRDEKSEPSDAHEGGEGLINDSEILEEFDAILSQSFDPNIYMIEEEEIAAEWQLRHLDILHQAAGHENLYEGGQCRGSLDQHQLPMMHANIHEESYYYPNMYNQSLASVREYGPEEPHGLSEFWQPHRHY